MKKRIMDGVLSARRAKLQAAEADIQNKRTEAFAFSDISDAQRAYSDSVFEDLLKGGSGNSKAVLSAHNAYVLALKVHGYNEKSFEYVPLCDKCNDSGVHDGKVCSCVRNEFLRALRVTCGFDGKAQFTFANFDASIIKNAEQRAELVAYYDIVSSYADKYPNVNRCNITLSGEPGTGKTCLASAFANKMLDKGQSVQFFSAYEFNAKMLACHISPLAERNGLMRDILSCDLLVIDDLGTEPMLRNVTAEYLLNVLSERFNHKRATLITTNLSSDDLLAIYGERIFSRVTDTRHSFFFALHGKDLRQ